jgi:2,3-bisphosphoglycerate-dependent phosphoglycerate mutase
MSQETKLWLVRHGETDWNAGSRLQGTIDIPLNVKGCEQAKLVADRLAILSCAVIYSSPLKRAFQTALPLSERLGLAVQTLADMAERNYGGFEGKTPDQIAAQDPEGFQRWQSRDPHFAPANGESLVQFNERVSKALNELARLHPGKTVVIFTHGGVLDIVYRLAQGLSLDLPRTWPIANAAINFLLVEQKRFLIKAWGDLDHLQGIGSRDEI